MDSTQSYRKSMKFVMSDIISYARASNYSQRQRHSILLNSLGNLTFFVTLFKLT